MLIQQFIKLKGDIISMKKFYSILIFLVLLVIGLCSCVEEEGITQQSLVPYQRKDHIDQRKERPEIKLGEEQWRVRIK